MPKKKKKIRTSREVLEDKIVNIEHNIFLKEQHLDNITQDYTKKIDDISLWLNKNKDLLTKKKSKYEEIELILKKWILLNLFFRKKRHSLKDKLTQIIIKNKFAEEEKKQKERNKKDKQEMHKAKAAQYDNKNWGRTEAIKSKVLKKQLIISNRCPYCNKEFENKNIHCDHIHPIHKGGLPKIRNLVYVCSKCNLQKKTDTVRQFCKKTNFNFDEIANRLERLDKDI